MADLQVSPISQLLHTLGITREDLNKRSDQMRQFLTADETISSRVLDRDGKYRSRSRSDLRSSSVSVGSSRSLARSLSRASSTSVKDSPPPVTPVKVEPHDGEIPHRRMDSMEMVIERQRRQRKSRREKERDPNRNIPLPPSPSPRSTMHSGHNLDTFMHSRDDSRSLSASNQADFDIELPEQSAQPPLVTPQKNKYYRDHTNISSGSQSRKKSIAKTETPTPTQNMILTQPAPQYYAYPGYVAYPPFMPMAYTPIANVTSSFPVTPSNRQQLTLRRKSMSPLPPSSPPLVSSPMSSPARRVNFVSSPGPMGPAPEETEYDNLPYKLPPGPYSPTKPDLSYAALVGRAILSSPEHRLTLQEIYDWITIVYPHYKRGETTWMNSIRHVLSTTVCFRKVPRDRSVGRTLWAIYDEDLECFKDGGFKKHLCKDYVNSGEMKEKPSGGSRSRARIRKRLDDDDGTDGRKAKKAKKVAATPSDPAYASTSFLGSASLSSHPLFPPSRPTSHHQPYYQSCVQQPPGFPTEVIFPPLPAAAAFNRVVNNKAPSSVKSDVSQNNSSPPSSDLASSTASSTSSSSLPELTPNRNSSSPPSSLLATSDADVDTHKIRPAEFKGDIELIKSGVTLVNVEDETDSSNDDDDCIFNETLLGPVRFWGESPKRLQPSIELLNCDGESDKDNSSVRTQKGKQIEGQPGSKNSIFPPIPTSPTLDRLARYSKSNTSVSAPSSSLTVPSTPPRSIHPQHEISSIRTPLSHKGLHMSPSTSLAHYKSNLDPPPVYNSGVPPLDVVSAKDQEDDDQMRTPRKRGSNKNMTSIFGHPVTPKKLVFSSVESPFRTPIASSPFRTPGSRSIYDPHDPRTLLNEELSRIGSAYDESPAGLYGKERGSLLYDSPGLDSPGKWSKWW